MSLAGTHWSDEEVRRLLSGIHKKKSVKEIASEHERTPGAIKAQLKKMAADYWFHDWRTVDQIMVYTGLTKREVEGAIKHRHATYPIIEENNTIVALKQEIATMKEDMKEVLRLMNAIYDFETK